jgi:glucose-6-phosphate 1-dehydrogenase
MKADSFAFVLVLATGDLAKRKILPALCKAHRVGSLPAAGKKVGVARGRFDSGAYREWCSEALLG